MSASLPENELVHTANKRAGVVETDISKFARPDTKLRRVRRYILDSSSNMTLETPPALEVEISDDIRWVVLKRLDGK